MGIHSTQGGSNATWPFDAELAWLRFWRRPARTLVGTWAVITAAAVTFVLSLGDGLHEYLSQRLQAFTPAIWVQAPPPLAGTQAPTPPVPETMVEEPPIAPTESTQAAPGETDEFVRRLRTLPGVTAVSKHVLSPVLASSGRRSSPARLEGYEPEAVLVILPVAGVRSRAGSPRSKAKSPSGPDSQLTWAFDSATRST